MFELNPLNLPDAMWQHVVMLVVAAIIGYIIGYRSSRVVAETLEAELDKLDAELSLCYDRKATFVATPPVMAAELPPIIPVIDPVLAIDPMAMAPVEPDDLKLIEGIGPKIEKLLNKEGILTFRHLSEATNERLVDILRAAGPRFQMHDPESWPQQSDMAGDGRWDELRAWQDILNKGRIA